MMLVVGKMQGNTKRGAFTLWKVCPPTPPPSRARARARARARPSPLAPMRGGPEEDASLA